MRLLTNGCHSAAGCCLFYLPFFSAPLVVLYFRKIFCVIHIFHANFLPSTFHIRFPFHRPFALHCFTAKQTAPGSGEVLLYCSAANSKVLRNAWYGYIFLFPKQKKLHKTEYPITSPISLKLSISCQAPVFWRSKTRCWRFGGSEIGAPPRMEDLCEVQC